jgi:hypothetical protein
MLSSSPRTLEHRVHSAAAAACTDPLLDAHVRDEPAGDRDDRLPGELVVVEAQIRRAGLVGRDRIERQSQAVHCAKAGLDQDHDRRSRRQIRQLIQRVLAFELAITNSSTNRGSGLVLCGISPR